MKTEQKLEVYRELFGSLPIAPDGKELIGLEYKIPKTGDYFFDYDPLDSNEWLMCTEHECRVYLVAIFQDTHRSDGTPLSIDPLPEVEGYRVEYFGQHLFPEYMGEATGYCIYACGKWHTHLSKEDKKPGGSALHCARLFKIAQPTTLADLVGEDKKSLEYLVGAVKVLLNEIETITKPNV